MLKLTKTGIGLLTKQYRSVLRKCWAKNVGLFTTIVLLTFMTPKIAGASNGCAALTSSSSIADIVACFTQRSVAIGSGAAIDGSFSLAIGYNTSARESGVALGDNSHARSVRSIALGMHSIANEEFSVALGAQSYAGDENIVSVGHRSVDVDGDDYTYGSDLFRRIVNVADGINAHDAVTLGQMNDALNYYYTKTEADARYALLDTIGDVDYSDEAADEGSALKNGEEDSPTTVRGALDLLDTKIGSLNETGIAGNDVATQLKYILENGSTGGTGVSLSTLGYIGANTPYLNTTNNAMNFSSTYTIGGNLSTLANQIKTNENSISALNTRVNNLGTYGGTLELTDNYGKIMGDVSVLRNGEALSTPGINTKAYATEQDLPLKSYTVELTLKKLTAGDHDRYLRIQVQATSAEEAEVKAKTQINNSWSDSHARSVDGTSWNAMNDNKYIYKTEDISEPIGHSTEYLEQAKAGVTSAEAKVIENNYTVVIQGGDGPGYTHGDLMTVKVNAENKADAIEKAKEYIKEGVWRNDAGKYENIYGPEGSSWGGNYTNSLNYITYSIENSVSENGSRIAEGSLGTEHDVLALGEGTIIENIALLDQAIGDLGTTGVSGASVAAQLKLLGEVGSEALGQKIGLWNTTKDSISQTLGETTKNYGYLTAFEYDSENEQYVGTVGDNLTALDTALSLTAKGLDALSHQLYNYYYTRTEADARYALLDTIGDVNYSDEAEDEDSALKNGAEDSPTTVRGALDLLDTKIGSLNETGIAGNDVATQLKYILENGSTGGAGVTLSTLGYIGANTPYLNTTNEAMNFSSTYTIGGNLSTLANQIKTNETNISNLSSRVNLLGSYSNGGADISENYAKVIGNTSIVTNIDNLKNDGNIVKAYATPATLNNKSYTVELTAGGEGGTYSRKFRIQVLAPTEEEAIYKAKNEINNSWSDYIVVQENHDKYVNKYMYATRVGEVYGEPIGVNIENINIMKEQINSTADATVTENNYRVVINLNGGGGYSPSTMTVNVQADRPQDAIAKAEEAIMDGFYVSNTGMYDNIYDSYQGGHWLDTKASSQEIVQGALNASTSKTKTLIAEGSLGTSDTYALGSHTIIENIALLDSAIGDLSATGVSGNSVAAQLQLLGEVGSEALGQKIGSWSTTKNSISQTLGDEAKNYGYLTAFEYDSENEQYVGTVGDNLTALDTALSLTAKGLDALSYDLYNYYYTFRVDERDEVTDSASFFQKDFSTLQKVDLQSKNPTHLRAFTKCDEACPRPSERFSLSLSQEQMLKNDASVDAGTSRHCLRQFGDVVADLLKNTAAKSLRIYEFMNEEVCHA